MDGAIVFESGEEEAAEARQKNEVPRTPHWRPRETVLLWCIGSVFGAGMFALLIGMCIAEIAIHRGMVETENHHSDASHVTLSATR